MELFRMNYDRAKDAAERRKERTENRNSSDEQDQQNSDRRFERPAG
ncbi:MAG: hypothetical protein H0U55_12190 [Rubrobacteraceae bacterium]|nr:hypothetical protein [Rubrobacteraceae bacterium]